MPQAFGGSQISNTAQIVDGIIQTGDIADSQITNAKMADNAIGYAEMADSAIKNAEVASDAAIDDSKLAEINDPDKVSGAALKNLSSIPAGAGIIPAANLPSIGIKLHKFNTDVVVSNPGNGVSTDILSVSVPGGTLGTGNALIGEIYVGSESWTTNGTNTYALKYGSTTIASFNIAGNATFKGVIKFMLQATGATNTQEGYILGSDGWTAIGSGTGAEDSTGALTLAVTFTPSASNPGDSITYSGGFVGKLN